MSELAILEWLQSIHGTFLDQVMIFITTTGNYGAVWIILGCVMICFEGWRRCGVATVVSTIAAYYLVELVLKAIFCRERPFMVEEFQLLIPPPSSWSFPSGHSAAALAGATAILIHKHRWGVAAIVYALLIAISRLYLTVHWPTDVLAGSLLGIGVAFFTVWFMSRYIPYFRELDKGEAWI